MIPMTTDNETPTIDVRGVSRRFGAKRALDGVSLTVPRGVVFGLIGENGAGKTTLIKHVLGLFRPQAGSVRVFGLDPVADPVGVLSRLGTLSEDRDLPGWMRVHELIRYSKAFYPRWDDVYAESLREAFELDPKARVKNLSRGQQARAGLLVALAFRPELLVLDEPSSGLDPVVRRDILGAIVRTIADEGRTVLFSSHLLDEVERVGDLVAMIDRGRIVLDGAIDNVKARHHRVTIHLDEPRDSAPVLDAAITVEGSGREWLALCEGELSQVIDEISRLGGRVVDDHLASLDEIFVARVASHRTRPRTRPEAALA
jgi:ABC-2 type transport system ATP-binding protein